MIFKVLSNPDHSDSMMTIKWGLARSAAADPVAFGDVKILNKLFSFMASHKTSPLSSVISSLGCPP